MSSIACGSSGQLQNVDQRTSTYSGGSSKKNVNVERPQPEKPPRKKAVTGKISSASSHASSHSGRHHRHDVSIYPSKQPTKTVSRDSRDEYDHDHHTFATATTASATISYSTDDVNSDVSEAGMEVVMSSKDSEMEDISPVVEYKTHSFPAGKHTFTVDERYTMLRVVGSGAYGVVISASDAKSSKNVAIKMVPRAFNDEIDAKRILREIKLLKHMKHENIVGIVDMMPPTARYLEDFHDVYIVADLMETDLHRIIYSKQKLSMDHVQYFIYQVLRGLKYIHSADVIHRDLKPSNLLVNSNCDLKICDFGLARGINEAHAEGRGGTMLLTEYVVTRWYRAPEIMLACHEYSKPIDLWSVGCIFAELIQRKPYFPGDDYIDQLTIISEKLGKLSEPELDFVTSDKAKRFMRKLPNKAVTPLNAQFPTAKPDALDLMRNMLQIHPRKRINVENALAHPFLAPLHSTEDEPVAANPFDFSFEKEKLHRVRLQELIWQEVGHFRPSCLPVAPRRGGGEPGGSYRQKDP
ncbi:serine/threonine protein kinase [Nitzschia inconspicua]|uniref:Mitogen-activated protein kinase n=1 Tax=Nitzschia inconspicua TaxID=303405 RepID=A0A9K3LFX6_9STRA|nr:serine/threonine protein kinase [Nitzschia inconspicua]